MIKVSDFTIEPVPKKTVTSFIEKWHYSHYAGGIQHRQCFALYSPDGKFGLPRMIGCMIYGQPAMSNTAAKYHPDNPDRCWELRRLCCIDDTPKNTESFFIGKTLKWLKQNTDAEVIISYSDLQQGHEGVVYKASNFINMGQTPSGQALMVDGKQYHDRTIRNKRPYARAIKRRWEEKQNGKKDDDIYFVETKPKNIYVYYLNKKLKKKMLK
jgi:hypothetical protein|tara:strand:- start:381 stop:1016 length:636 start_codon:yes stop_codon:yes gene_type:complete